MNIDVLRKVDRHLGFWVFLLLVVLFRCCRRRRPAKPAAEVKGIVVIKYFGLGSILLLSPSLRELRKRFPAASIYFLTRQNHRDFCQAVLEIDEVFGLDLKNLGSWAASGWEVLRKLSGKEIDIVLDVEFLTQFSAISTLLVKHIHPGAISYGFCSPSPWRNYAYDYPVVFDHTKHITRIFAKLVFTLFDRPAGEVSFAPERDRLRTYGTTGMREKLARQYPLLRDCRKWVAVNVHTGSLSLQRRWPLANFAEVVASLLARGDVGVLLIGDAEEQDYAAPLRRQWQGEGRIVDLCGKTSLRDLTGLLFDLDLLLTNDSGPLHLSHVIGLPTVSLFGPETPSLYGPLPSHKHVVLYKDCWCSPCINIYNSKMTRCRENHCLREIKPAEVIAVLQGLL